MIRSNGAWEFVENLDGFVKPLVGFVNLLGETHCSMNDREAILGWLSCIGGRKGAERSRRRGAVQSSRGEQRSRGVSAIHSSVSHTHIIRNGCVTSTLHGSDFGSCPYMRIKGRCVYVYVRYRFEFKHIASTLDVNPL
jgi:hypothetical protein